LTNARSTVQYAFGSVWHLLLDTSTDNLDRLARGTDVRWEELDHRFAKDFAHCWDEITRSGSLGRRYTASADIREVRRGIEQWGLHSLLLTERARRMFRYPLPNLTCLYRCCDRIDGSFLQLSYVSRANMVADVDFSRSLERIGLNWEEIQRIDAWLKGVDRYSSAASALRRINRLGLRRVMNDQARAHVGHVLAGAEHSCGCQYPIPSQRVSRRRARQERGVPQVPVDWRNPAR